VSRALFPRFERSSAGQLTKIRAQTVSRRSCVEVARALGVPDRIREAESVEAGIGASFLEYGFETTAEAVAEAFHDQIEFAIANVSDFKSELQERLAQRGEFVTYRVVKEEGPPHDRRFETVAEVDGLALGTGSGRSKKESEQEAARKALDHLGGSDPE
jgi:ribonuclease III